MMNILKIDNKSFMIFAFNFMTPCLKNGLQIKELFLKGELFVVNHYIDVLIFFVILSVTNIGLVRLTISSSKLMQHLMTFSSLLYCEGGCEK